MGKITGIVIPVGVALLGVGLVYGQFGRGGGDWSTSGYDAQRSFWLRSDPKISLKTLEKPGFQMIWKLKLANAPKASPLTDAVLVERYIGYRGFRTYGFMGGTANGVYAVDTDLSRIEWQMHLPGSGTSPCAANLVTQVARPTGLDIATAGGGGGRPGRGGFARSGVGQSGEGAPTIAEAAMRGPARPPANAGPAGRGGRNAGRAAAAIPNAYRRGPSYLYALTSDGLLHQMYVSNGLEPEPAFKFLPANSNATGLVVISDVAYAVTAKGCAGTTEGVWALDLKSKKVTSWKGPVAGSAGIAFDPDGTLFVATGSGAGAQANSIVALDSKTLQPKDWYSAGSAFTSSPVIFEYKDKLLAAATTQDGQVHLTDTASLGGANHKSALAHSDANTKAAAGALATWEDSNHVRWILASTGKSIAAWKVVDRNNAPTLESGWVSPDMASPLPPMILNDVVFAVAGGNPSTPAVLYALDPATGKEVWNSGKDIAASVPSGGLSAGGSQLYVGADDGTMYAFGFPMEH